jgi:hypothetical protein
VTLGAKTINFIRLHLLNNPDQICAIREASIMENEARGKFIENPDKDDQSELS